MHLKTRYALLFIFIFSYFSFSQNSITTNYTTADGLRNNAVHALFLDKKSDLWIGTESGISTFENGIFTPFNFSKNNESINCWDITQDSKGAMWFASYGNGIYKYDGKKNTLLTTRNGLPTNRIRKIISFKNFVIAGTEIGIVIINTENNKINVPKGIVPHLGVFIVTDFLIYKDEVYFSALNEGLFKIDSINNIPYIKQILSYKNIYSLGFYNDTIYSSNKDFVNTYSIKDIISGKPKFQNFGNSVIWDYVTIENTIFATAWGIFDSSGGLYTIENNIMKNVSEQFGINSNQLLNIVYNPKSKIVYVGSKDKGIYEIRINSAIKKISFKNKSIIDFEKIDNKKIILHQDGVTFLNETDTNLYNINSTNFKNYEVDFIKNTNLKLPNHNDGFYELNYNLSADKIEYYEIVTHNKSIWITSNIGVFELNFKGKIINYIPIHSYKIAFSTDDKFIETIPYAGERVYENVYKLKSKHFSEFDKNTPKDILKTLNHNNKTYLISVFDGLFTYQNGNFKSYYNSRIWNEKKLKFITKNDRGDLVIASESNCIFIVNVTEKFKILEKIPKEKIIGNTVTFLECYKENLLIGTEKGITIYNKGTIRFIDKEQGFIDNIVTTSQLFNNNLWLGTKNGYYIINLSKQLSNHPSVSKLKIKNVSINGVSIDKLKPNLLNSNNLTLQYQQNSISVDFVPKGNLYLNKLKYRYRVKNENLWSPYSDKPTVYLSYLPSDNYNLEIEVKDLHSGKTSIFKLLTIVINPPFWKNWWFIALIFFLLVFTLIFIIYKIKKNAKKNQITQQIIAQSKLEALLSQMNPHFTFNALNAIQNFVFNNDTHNSTIYMAEFAQLIRQTLDNSTKQIHSIESEIDYIEKYIKIENLRFDNKVAYQINIDPDIDIELDTIPPMILQPFVENIFNHAFTENSIDPKFYIILKLEENQLKIVIKDNGNGKTIKQNNHISKGIAITQQRIQLIQPENKNPIIITFTDTGTSITIILLKPFL